MNTGKRPRNVPLSPLLASYGLLIRTLRLHGKENDVERRWTRDELADRIDVSVTHLGRIEAGAAEPGMLLAWRLANVFHLTVDDMLRLAEDRVKTDGSARVPKEEP